MITYVIPSYDRARTLSRKTLKMLRENNIPEERIVIVVANQEQKEHYNIVLSNKYTIWIGEKGIVEVRNWIRKKFDTQKIVMLDDDISGVFRKQDVVGKANQQFLKIFNLHTYVELAFTILEKSKSRLFGFGGSLNPLGIVHDIKRGIVQVSALYCEICDGDIQIGSNLGTIDDLEISLRYYKKYGDNYRYNIISHNAGKNARLEPGGLQSIMSPANRDLEELKERQEFVDRNIGFISSSKIKNHKLRIYWKRCYSSFNKLSDFSNLS